MLRNATNLLSMNILLSDRDIWKSSTSNVEKQKSNVRERNLLPSLLYVELV